MIVFCTNEDWKALYGCLKPSTLSFPRRRETSDFWMPDRVRHDNTILRLLIRLMIKRFHSGKSFELN